MYHGKLSAYRENLRIWFGKQVTSKSWKIGPIAALQARSATDSHSSYSAPVTGT